MHHSRRGGCPVGAAKRSLRRRPADCAVYADWGRGSAKSKIALEKRSFVNKYHKHWAPRLLVNWTSRVQINLAQAKLSNHPEVSAQYNLCDPGNLRID